MLVQISEEFNKNMELKELELFKKENELQLQINTLQMECNMLNEEKLSNSEIQT